MTTTSDEQTYIELTFDNNGSLNSWSNDGETLNSNIDNISFDAFAVTTGANPIEITDLNLSSLHQNNANFEIEELEQNGFSTGILSNVDISTDGIINLYFSNNQKTEAANIAVATFSDESVLTKEDFGYSATQGSENIGSATEKQITIDKIGY